MWRKTTGTRWTEHKQNDEAAVNEANEDRTNRNNEKKNRRNVLVTNHYGRAN